MARSLDRALLFSLDDRIAWIDGQEGGGKMLKGKIAIVTGASSGIGRATAIAMGANGAKVAAVGRTSEDLSKAAQQIRAAGGEAVALTADLRVEADCRKLVDSTVETFGGLDILVNSAGIIAT